MSDLKTVISHGRDEKGKWFVVSEGISAITGKDKLRGPKIRISDEQKYSCSCTVPPFRVIEEECIHIKSVKAVEEEVRTKGKEIIPYKQKEILELQTRVDELKAIEEKYGQENRQLLDRILSLQCEVKTAKADRAYNLEDKIRNLQKEKDLKSIELAHILGEKSRILQENEEKENGLQQYITMIEEQLENEKKKSFSLKSTLESFKRSGSAHDIPPEIISRLSVLCDIDDAILVARLHDEIYKNIPKSVKKPKEKIKLGTVEHSQPKKFYNFVEQLSNIEIIDEISCSSLSSCKKTKIKAIHAPGVLLPNGQKSKSWIVQMVYARDNFASDLDLKTTARNKIEAMAIEHYIKLALKI